MPATKIKLDRPLIKELPVVYEGGEPTAVLIDIEVFDLLLERLGEVEDRELFNDPKVIARLREAREDHLAGRVTSHADLIRELGLEGDHGLRCALEEGQVQGGSIAKSLRPALLQGRRPCLPVLRQAGMRS